MTARTARTARRWYMGTSKHPKTPKSITLRARRVLFAVLSVLAVISAVPVQAQFFAFGQNKIQYRKLDWRIIRGPHVDLYYYPAEAELAPAALAYAEASYDTLSVQFGHHVKARIPLIVYACWVPPIS
jgi:hypothetical protein